MIDDETYEYQVQFDTPTKLLYTESSPKIPNRKGAIMDQAFKIIEMFQNKVPIDEIEKEIPWDNLTQADYEKLFAEADQLRGTRNGFDLLGLMYKAVKDKEFWMETRILAAVIARPDTDVERSKLLKRMAYCLEEIRSILTKVPKSDPQQLRYRRYLCDYVFLSARLLEEAGDIDNALKEYVAAQKAYIEYSFLTAAKEVDESIIRLQKLKRQGDQLIPIESLTDRKSFLEKEISDLDLKSQEKSRLLEEASENLKKKETELLNLNLIIDELETRLETSQESLQKLKDENSDLESKRENSSALLEKVEQEKSDLVEQIITLREQAQDLDVRVAQTALKLNDRLAALQAQIDLKESELGKIESTINKKTEISDQLEQLITHRRQELAMTEEALHKEEAHLFELSLRRTQAETEAKTEHVANEALAEEESVDDSNADMARKLEKYKKSLKASRTRKKAATNRNSEEA